jgi:hypothetical protein
MSEVHDIVKAALECSIYVSPRERGLTVEELVEVAQRVGLKRGEILDAIPQATGPRYFGDKYLQMPKDYYASEFHFEQAPEYRNVTAFEFVNTYLREMVRSEGRAAARVSRSVLVANGAGQGIAEIDLEVAVTMYLINDHLVEKDGQLSFAPGRESYALPSLQVSQRGRDVKRARPRLREIYEAVKDVIARRSDGRPPSADPLAAFESYLDRIGQGRFRIWWARTVAELRCANESTSPLTVCVLAAALSEGALVFVVGHAKALGLSTLASKTFDESSKRWKFDDLLTSAAAGGADAVFDSKVKDRADRLNIIRQRIHAGRLMADQPTGPIPDTRPEEAREAFESLQIIVRRVIDWLDAHPTRS